MTMTLLLAGVIKPRNPQRKRRNQSRILGLPGVAGVRQQPLLPRKRTYGPLMMTRLMTRKIALSKTTTSGDGPALQRKRSLLKSPRMMLKMTPGIFWLRTRNLKRKRMNQPRMQKIPLTTYGRLLTKRRNP
jgi:hypothetical protein